MEPKITLIDKIFMKSTGINMINGATDDTD